MTAQDLEKYHWYHCIPLPGTDLITPGHKHFEPTWPWIKTHMAALDFKDKIVLDVGARDCLFSLEAEARGAAIIDAIDNDLSEGALNVVLPAHRSKIKLRKLNLYSLPMPGLGPYDIILFFGVLYHLRYPFRGLRCLIDSLKVGGQIAIEAGMLNDPTLADMEILYCPVERSPFEPSSCSFFNACALDVTMRSMGCRRIYGFEYFTPARIVRGFAAYEKTEVLRQPYWEGVHSNHSQGKESPSDWAKV